MEELKALHFPAAGISVSQAFWKQPNRNIGPGKSDYARTTPIGINVRGYEPGAERLRGGSRPGISKYLATQVHATEWVVQDLNVLVSISGDPVQTSQSGRLVTLVAVSQGYVVACNAGDTVWTEATNNTGETPPLNYTGLMFSSANIQRLYFADGINWAYYVPSTNSVETWTASAGSLPVDSDSNTPRLICTWRGRTVLSGLFGDPQNIFFSAVGDPSDFDYAPSSPSAIDAVALNLPPYGLIGDVVTGLCPYTDDILIVFCDHSIFLFRGDPLAGGQIDMVSSSIGGAWGRAFCMDPFGNIYFYSNKNGVYMMTPSSQSQRVSQEIDPLLADVDTGANGIRLIWDDRAQGVHVFITQLDEPAACTHYFMEARTHAWWQDKFANNDHNPLCCVTFDGNEPGDRVTLIGCWDGYVRAIDHAATTDDGTDIESRVIIALMNTPSMDDILAKDLVAVLGEDSGNVDYAVYVGTTAEQALSSIAITSGEWSAGRGYNTPARCSGHAIWIDVSSSDPWSMEQIRIRLAGTGKVRGRNP